MRPARSIGIAVILGLLVGAVLYGAISLFAQHSRRLDVWMAFPEQLLIALVAIAPGVTAGFAAGRSGFTVGGITGVLVSIASSTFLAHLVPDESIGNMVLYATAFALAGLLTNGVGGIAGVALARRRGTDAF